MKKLSTRVEHWNNCTMTITRYRLHIENTHVCLEAQLAKWETGEVEFRVDFWTGVTCRKNCGGGMHNWNNPIAAFRIISEAIQTLYEGQIGKSLLLVFATDDKRLRIYKKIMEKLARRQGGSVVEGWTDSNGFKGLEYKP